MLEIKLSSLKSVLKFISYIFIPFWVAFMIGGVKVMNVSNDQIFTYIIFMSIAGIIVFLYFYMRYLVEKKALENYLQTLKTGQFREALSYGRIYYSIKRKGFSGANGSGLTIYDESAISNDIAAYSRQS